MGEHGRLGGLGSEQRPASSSRQSVGIKRITRPGGKQVYRLAFSFRGQCRETVALPHSKANDLYCERLRGEILRAIELGTFRYGDYFPDSPRAAAFGHGSARTKTLKVLLEAYRDRVEKTFAHSTFSAVRKAIDNVLIPWCGSKRPHELSPSDIRAWVSSQTTSLKRIRNVVWPLRTVFDELVSDGAIEFNPFTRVKLAKLVPEDRRTSDYEPDT